jgi:hypothetical protein
MYWKRFCVWALSAGATALAACSGGRPAGGDVHEVSPGDVSQDVAPDTPVVFPEVDSGPSGDADAQLWDTDAAVTDGGEVWAPIACESHADCPDGYCVELVPGSGDSYCAPTCIEECPLDWVCKAVYIDGPDPVSICLPPSGPCVARDLVHDGKDEDCDGKTDEDVPEGARLWSYLFGSGFGTASGGGLVLRARTGAPAVHGQSSGSGFVLVPGSGSAWEGK